MVFMLSVYSCTQNIQPVGFDPVVRVWGGGHACPLRPRSCFGGSGAHVGWPTGPISDRCSTRRDSEATKEYVLSDRREER